MSPFPNRCRYCGAWSTSIDPEGSHVHVTCTECRARGPQGKTAVEAVLYWNTGNTDSPAAPLTISRTDLFAAAVLQTLLSDRVVTLTPEGMARKAAKHAQLLAQELDCLDGPPPDIHHQMALEELKERARALGAHLGTLPIEEGYYHACCNACTWTGSSQYLTSCGNEGGDTSLYCPVCGSEKVDEIISY